MANQEHLKIFMQGEPSWFEWRLKNLTTRPNFDGVDFSGSNLSKADLSQTDLNGANLRNANLSGADLSDTDLFQTNLCNANLSKATLHSAQLHEANLSGANLKCASLSDADFEDAKLNRAILDESHLSGARFYRADLRKASLIKASFYRTYLSCADLRGADLSGADLRFVDLVEADLSRASLKGASLFGANLYGANLSKADLGGANLSYTNLVEANVRLARITNCRVYGASVWNLRGKPSEQSDLIITPMGESAITVDNLEVAQFVYLLLNNERIRDVIDTITTKVVLILGCFTPERKAILDAIRGKLRACNYLPILFDFKEPTSRDTHETVTTLARLARFIIADITQPRSVPQELVSIVETLPSVPVQPLLQSGGKPWGMYDHIKSYPWVLKLYKYNTLVDLLASFEQNVIIPAEARAKNSSTKSKYRVRRK